MSINCIFKSSSSTNLADIIANQIGTAGGDRRFLASEVSWPSPASEKGRMIGLI